MSAAEFRTLLEAGDVNGLRTVWHAAFPGMPQPKNYDEAEIVMHLTRSASETITLRCRAYSHRWLCERDLPSQLPDHLRPSAERMYPRVASAVGISVNTQSELLRPALGEVRKAMEEAVLEADADRRIEDAAFVKARMQEAKDKTLRTLFGR